MMRRWLLPVLASIVMATVSAAAVQQPPAPPPAAAFTGAVSDEQGGPMRDLSLVIFPVDSSVWDEARDPKRFQVTGLSTGRFSFADLPPGDYRVTVLTPALISEWPSAELLGRIQRRAFPVHLAAGAPTGMDFVVNMSGPDPGIVRAIGGRTMDVSTATGAVLGPGRAPALPPGPGAISGTVVDATGAPVVNAEVRAMRRVATNGQPQIAITGQPSTTDAAGRYRITGLRPGDYLVAAPKDVLDRGTALGVTASRLPASTVQPDGTTLGYVTTFYPGVRSSDGARTIPVSQQEVQRIDFAVQRTIVVEVTGVVTGGRVMSALTLSPASALDQLGGVNVQRQAVAGDGTFRFVDVPLGAYVLSGGGIGAAGRAEIVVSATRREPIRLALRPTVMVTGRVEFRGGPAPGAAELGSFQVRLVPEQQVPGSPLYLGTVRPSGDFAIQNIQKGRYHLLATTPPPWTQTAGLVAGVDTMYVAIDLTADVTGAVVALGIKR